jgi:cation diffusion facilitator CzcD-associated flavoprotein CzcO
VENSERFVGKIMHSHDYREGAPFKDQQVLVVGGSFSALDITMELAKWCTKVCAHLRPKQAQNKLQ